MAENWPELLEGALGHRSGSQFGAAQSLRVFVQPIADVTRGTIVGYEALARFSAISGFPGLTPDHWFEAAHVHGVGAELEAVALAKALARRGELPRNCFLSVNLSPEVIAHPAVRSVITTAGDLDGIVIELTEHSRIDSFSALEPVLEW